ncbi:MAG: hypothetical protein K2Y01_02810 [Rhabdochlamydiaceae bacterium]|nr:hypothetical protein [Rhabdochlamydiaceae bacterium]
MIKIVAYSFAVLCLGYASLEKCKEIGFYPSEKAYREVGLVPPELQEVFVEAPREDFKRQADPKSGEWACKNCHACNPNYKLYCGICWN